MATFSDFQELDIRIAKIENAEKVEGADKLLKLQISMGDEKRQLAAGIAEWYSPEDLMGRQVVVLANLEAKTIRGIESQGMLLAADTNGKAVLLKPDSEVPEGSKVR